MWIVVIIVLLLLARGQNSTAAPSISTPQIQRPILSPTIGTPPANPFTEPQPTGAPTDSGSNQLMDDPVLSTTVSLTGTPSWSWVPDPSRPGNLIQSYLLPKASIGPVPSLVGPPVSRDAFTVQNDGAGNMSAALSPAAAASIDADTSTLGQLTGDTNPAPVATNTVPNPIPDVFNLTSGQSFDSFSPDTPQAFRLQLVESQVQQNPALRGLIPAGYGV